MLWVWVWVFVSECLYLKVLYFLLGMHNNISRRSFTFLRHMKSIELWTVLGLMTFVIIF